MRIICQLLCLCALLLWPAHSAAKAVSLSSDNFVLSGNISEDKGQELLEDLELFRESLFHLMGAKALGEPVPVKIYAAKNDKEIGQISGERGFGGLYTRSHKGPSLLINSKTGFGRKNKGGGGARHIALHEYSHHLFNMHIPYGLPRWYNEGLADYLATFTYKNGVFHIGKPYETAMAALGAGDWLPIETILNSVNAYPFEGEEGALNQSFAAQKFYAQSWLMVHYIQSRKDYRALIENYAARVMSGEDSPAAFEAVFNLSPQAFEDKLRSYYKQGDYETRIFSRPPSPLPSVKRETLSRAQLQLAKLSARADFSQGRSRAAGAIEAIEKYERKYKPSAQSLILKADLAELTSEAVDAEEAFEAAYGFIQSALAQEPDNLEAKLSAARLIMRAQSLGIDITSAQRALARGYVEQVLGEYPNHRFGRALQRLILAQAP